MRRATLSLALSVLLVGGAGKPVAAQLRGEKRTTHELLLPFSCKNRGLCPSCTARRMSDEAA